MNSAVDSVQSGASGRTSILGTLSPRTRALALVALIVEALFLLGAAFLPESQRIFAFSICAALLALLVASCVWLESQEVFARPGTPLILPTAMTGQYIFVDAATKSAVGLAADLYRTASNFKFVGRFEDAISYYEKTIKAAPDHFKAKYNIGSCLMYLGRLEEAAKRFESLAVELEALHPQTQTIECELLHGCFIQLNNICSERRLYAEGIPYLIRSWSIKPDDALSYLNLIVATLKSGMQEEARKWHQILFAHPEHIQALSSLTEKDKELLDSINTKKGT